MREKRERNKETESLGVGCMAARLHGCTAAKLGQIKRVATAAMWALAAVAVRCVQTAAA